MKINLLAGMMLPFAVLAEPGQSPRDAFIKRQAYEETQRIAGQMDILEQNQAALSERISRIERGGGEVREIKAEIDALKADIARLRNEMAAQRKEIVDDIVKRIKSMPRQDPTPPPPSTRTPPPQPQYSGPCGEYTVRPGDNLYIIAKAFDTSVAKIREMNSLKSDVLKVGQKILVPQDAPKKR